MMQIIMNIIDIWWNGAVSSYNSPVQFKPDSFLAGFIMTIILWMILECFMIFKGLEYDSKRNFYFLNFAGIILSAELSFIFSMVPLRFVFLIIPVIVLKEAIWKFNVWYNVDRKNKSQQNLEEKNKSQ